MGIARRILRKIKGGIGRLTLFEVEVVEVVICRSRVVKMKEYLPFCREFNILCIEDRVVTVELVV